MPQIVVDTDRESVASLNLLGKLMFDYINLKILEEEGLVTSYPAHPNGDVSAAAITAALRAAGNTVETNTEPKLVTQGSGMPELAAAFGKSPLPADVVPIAPEGTTLPGNVINFPQPATQALPTLGVPVINAAPAADNTAQPSAPTAPVSPADTSTVSVASGGQGVELDSAGIPWDARIHQTSRNKKKGDNTWMLKRGLDEAIAAAVIAELIAAKSAGPVLVSLPPAVANPVSMPAIQPNVPTGMPVLTQPPIPGMAAGLPTTGLPSPGAVLTPVQQFQAMMRKISAALKAGAEGQPGGITQEQVAATHTALGLQQLQLAITRPETIPQIEQALGL